MNNSTIEKITLPITNEQIKSLKAGDVVSLSGCVYTARDAAHKRFCEALDGGEQLPINIKGAAIYYCGPTPAVNGEIIGSCGPTTSARMDDYTPRLLKEGLKVMIGKGKRSGAVNAAIKQYGAVYLVAIGGAGALIKNKVVKNTPVAYEDLGCEAVRELEFRDLQLLVACDSRGKSALK